MERGILFSAEMIQAYLRGDKSQTRRMKNLRVINGQPDNFKFLYFVKHPKEKVQKAVFEFKGRRFQKEITLPYGPEGDSLWFRETYSETVTGIKYRADGWEDVVAKYDIKWKPAIFMPKAISRFREIPITRVRVQRLRDIDWEDAVAEGIPHTFSEVDLQAYFDLFYKVNGLTSHINPWLWVYEFPVHKGA